MSAQSSRATTWLALALLTALVPLGVTVPRAYAEPLDPPAFTAVPAGIPNAETALATATATMSGHLASPDLTFALRDLSARLPEYTGADLRLAKALLARPNGGDESVEVTTGAAWNKPEASESPLCDAPIDPIVCVHWAASGKHAPPPVDGPDAGTVPDQVDATLAVLLNVWNTEITGYGYRQPLTDERASRDSGAGFDVYLSDIGGNGYYGYCATDDSRTFGNYAGYDRAAYCVLDNDYSPTEFPANSPAQNLKVTAAHEFFHAVQFAYDAFDDVWFMEGTAAWIEDEVYDRIDDNRQFLWDSQFQRPGRSLDTGFGGPEYGSWGFFRYLTEHFGSDVVRDAWVRADGAPGGPDDYSLNAIRDALALRGADLHDVYADYAASLINPSLYFDEGQYYPSPFVRQLRLGGVTDNTGWQRARVDHLATAFRSAVPKRTVPKHAQVRVRIDAPRRVTSPRSVVIVEYRNGTVRTQQITLSRTGAGTADVPFSHARVRRVVVALVNGSDRFVCFQGTTPYSCSGGEPLDDNSRFRVKISIR